MLKFAANLNTLFQELSFLDRFAAAADAGFRGVEILRPYEHPKQVLAKRMRTAGLECALLNSPAGNWNGGERGLACHAGRVEEFRHSIEVGLRYCEALGCPRLHVLAGIAQPGSNREVYIDNLRWAAQRAGNEVTVLIEAINLRDMPGYFLNTQAESATVVEAVGLANLKMQIDCYHMQIVDGDLTTRLRQYFSRCGHIQIAGVPDRHEPDTGEVNYAHVFALLKDLGYQDWIGCEYHPRAGTFEGLEWVERLTGHKLS